MKLIACIFVISRAAVAACLYGNHDIHEKMVQVMDGLKGMDSTVTDLEIKVT